MNKKNKRDPITDMSEEMRSPEGKMMFMADAMDRRSNAIIHQERRGQQELVSQTTRLQRPDDEATKVALEKFGVKFIGKINDNQLFVQVELPKGWKIIATEHHMYSFLVDEKGRHRANLFYKAAYYDQKVHCYALRRYKIEGVYDGDKYVAARILDGGIAEIHRIEADKEKLPNYVLSKKPEAEAVKWLNEHFSEWENVISYWD